MNQCFTSEIKPLINNDGSWCCFNIECLARYRFLNDKEEVGPVRATFLFNQTRWGVDQSNYRPGTMFNSPFKTQLKHNEEATRWRRKRPIG